MKTQLNSLLSAFALALLLGSHASAVSAQEAVVYKSPTCGCCSAWVDYLRDNDFTVETIDLENLDAIKEERGISRNLQSCHPALIDGYVIEGHVPVDDIKRLLEERPEITGLSAPGMPMMSPGMASLTPRDYDVLSFDDAGNIEVYSRY